MKKFAVLLIIGLSLICFGKSFAQVGIWLDSAYGSTGKMEINIGGFNNEITGYIVNHDSKVMTICGKIGTATSGNYRFGMARFDSSGKLDPSFGAAGIVNLSWNTTEYPTCMRQYYDNDSNYILAGKIGSSASNTTWLPSLYRFKKNGIPDSSFGTDGRITVKFDGYSSGEADHVFISTLVNHFGYVLCGTSRAIDAAGKTGFGVARIDSNGTIDSDFGFSGRAVIPALVHSVNGFLLNDNNIFMCGVSDTGKPEILIARFIESATKIGGVPDSSVGVNGLIHTGIFLPVGDSIMAALQGDDNIVVLLPAPDSSSTPITLCRFNPRGSLDSTYGKFGIARNYITPSFKIKGLIVSSDNSSFVSGMTNTGLGQSIFMRLNDTSAAPDPKYFLNGTAVFDMDNGTNPNYMKYLEPIGKLAANSPFKRYAGVGGSIHNGIEYMMIARFITGPVNNDVSDHALVQNNSLTIYPDPIISGFTVQVAGDKIKNVKVIDALGRMVLMLEPKGFLADTKTYSLDASKMPNGLYYCIVQTASEQLMRKFIVSH